MRLRGASIRQSCVCIDRKLFSEHQVRLNFRKEKNIALLDHTVSFFPERHARKITSVVHHCD